MAQPASTTARLYSAVVAGKPAAQSDGPNSDPAASDRLASGRNTTAVTGTASAHHSPVSSKPGPALGPTTASTVPPTHSPVKIKTEPELVQLNDDSRRPISCRTVGAGLGPGPNSLKGQQQPKQEPIVITDSDGPESDHTPPPSVPSRAGLAAPPRGLASAVTAVQATRNRRRGVASRASATSSSDVSEAEGGTARGGRVGYRNGRGAAAAGGSISDESELGSGGGQSERGSDADPAEDHSDLDYDDDEDGDGDERDGGDMSENDDQDLESMLYTSCSEEDSDAETIEFEPLSGSDASEVELDPEMVRFKIPDPSQRMLTGRRGAYAVAKKDMPRSVRHDLRAFREHCCAQICTERGSATSMAETSYAKTEERVRCLLGWMDDVTQGEIFQGQAPRLELIFWEKRHILIQYIHFLSDRRQLAAGTITQHASTIVTLFKYFINTTRSITRRVEFTRFHRQWRTFRNRLQNQYMRYMKSRDRESEREKGTVLLSFEEGVLVAGHLLRRAYDKKANGEDVQEAAVVSVFALMPALRQGIWRTLEYHQDALDNPQRKKNLERKKCNFVYYDPEAEAFVLRVTHSHKRDAPLTLYVRRSELEQVHDILALWMFQFRVALLRRSQDRNAGRDSVFFHPRTGVPFGNPSKMAMYVTGVVRRAALELGLYPNKVHRLKCSPHTFRHALYEYVHSSNTPQHVKESVAAACLHTVSTADQWYGRVNQDEKGRLAREYVYGAAARFLETGKRAGADNTAQRSAVPRRSAIAAANESSADTSRGKGKAPQTMVSDSDPEASDHEPPAAARANGKRTWGGVALQYPSRKSESSANTSHGKGKAPQTTVSDSCDPEASDDEPPAAARANGKRTWGGVALQYPSRKRPITDTPAGDGNTAEPEESSPPPKQRTLAACGSRGSKDGSNRSSPPSAATSALPPQVNTLAALLAPGSTHKSPRVRFVLVLSVTKAMSLDPASGAQDWDARVGPLREVDSDMGEDTLRAFRLQIGGSFKVRATTLVYPIDYSRDHRGRYIIYTTPRDVHEAVVGVKPVLLRSPWLGL